MGMSEISVPSGWVVYAGDNCNGETGVLLAVPANESGCANASDEAEIGNFVPPTDPYSLKSNATVNGIPVALQSGTAGASEELALSMFVEARGALATQILGTLTYAPDYAILLTSRKVNPPVSWQGVAFGGITFRAPRAWTIERDSVWGGCPGNIQSGVIRLSTAQRDSMPSCPVSLSDAASWAGVPGVVVGAGPAVVGGEGVDTSRDSCQSVHELRVCIEPVPLNGGLEPGLQLNLLTALVFLPGQARPDQVEIGLAGSGQVADAIFDSIRPTG